jgi:hypothetical protein
LGGGGNTYAERYGSSLSNNSALVSIQKPPTKTISHDELRYLQLYQLKIAHTASGWFSSSFWNETVLPAASFEPAVFHAAIAFSAAHRVTFDSSQAPDLRERFMLQQYSKAIHSIQLLLQRYDKASITVALVACQLFTFLEYLRGKHRLAETHFRNGLRMLKDLSTESGCPQHGILVLGPSSYLNVVNKGIVRSFATLHMQSDLFGSNLKDVDMFLRPMENDIPHPTFKNAAEAKDSLDTLVHRIVVMSQRFRQSGPGSEVDWSVVSLAHEQITALLAAWYDTYLRTVAEDGDRVRSLKQTTQTPLAFGTQTPPGEHPMLREPLAFKLLLVYHSMATIMCACLRSHSEIQYEAYTPVFLSMLEHTVDVFKQYLRARTITNNVNIHDSIGEYGFIVPLYYIATKCRVHRIRLHAIRLLRENPYKEGPWDSSLAANIAHTVMELEERYVYCRRSVDENFSLLEMPILDPGSASPLPECSMFHDVQVQMQDVANKATVTCDRWRVDGSLETIIFHADDKREPEDEAKRWWSMSAAKCMSLKD